MDTRTYKVYKYHELNEEQKEKALQNLADINVDYDWWDDTFTDAKTVGVEIKEFDIYRNNIDGDFLYDAYEVAELILKEHGRTADTYKLATSYLADYEKARKEYEKTGSEAAIEALGRDFRHDIFEEYLSILRKEFDYLTSKEAIIETIEANEYDFTKDGKLD